MPWLACVLEYMPWFRLHGKPYLLTPEQRQRQIRVGRERHGPLIPRRGDDDAGPSTRPRQSPGPSSVAMKSPGPTRAPTHPMAGWDQWPGSAPFSVTPSGPPMYRPATHEGSQEGPLGSSSFYQSPPPYGFQTPSPMVIQTPPHSLFFQGGSSSQVRQPDALPEEPESPPEEP
ncbi:hypothetical protein Godav_000135 [Gossypium davidsonii]|uniref:Uncharacterized protein n=1 Tax=Gossypium davidsonii TaxID=34287 RepID=A0A7J8TCJ3_GOSDV|nr:hypothetical protein [Gossypium davidsonii]